MSENLTNTARATLAAAGLLLLSFSHTASAVVVDTFDRADGTDLGTTEVGGYTYVERHTSIAAPSGLRDTALILDNRLVVPGQQSTDPAVAPNPALYGKTQGLVYLNGYDSADATVSMRVGFDNQNNAPSATERAASSVGVLFRFAPESIFTSTGGAATSTGVLGAEILPNGGVLIREYNGAGLTSIYAANPFRGDAANDWRFTAGSLGTTFGGQPFDVNDNGILEVGETFDLSLALAGNTITMSINGQELVTRSTLGFTGGAGSADGVGVYKNLISGSFEIASNIIVDDLNVSPVAVPEPTALSLLAAGGLLAMRRRRAR